MGVFFRRYQFHMCISFFLTFLSSCAHSPLPYLPEGTKLEAQYENLTECKQEACLQIFIMYGRYGCSHTALRLHIADMEPVFWDPAGAYGKEGSIMAQRVNDLVIHPVPSMNDYIQFRTEIPTEALEMFEFHINRSKAIFLADILRGKNVGNTFFETKGVGFFCSYHVSEFLQKYLSDVYTVKQVFLPHNLASQLYDIGPDRIIIISMEGDEILVDVKNKVLH